MKAFKLCDRHPASRLFQKDSRTVGLPDATTTHSMGLESALLTDLEITPFSYKRHIASWSADLQARTPVTLIVVVNAQTDCCPCGFVGSGLFHGSGVSRRQRACHVAHDDGVSPDDENDMIVRTRARRACGCVPGDRGEPERCRGERPSSTRTVSAYCSPR